MLASYKNLTISTKLLLSNLAFALPMAVLIFFMNISFTYDINIGKNELAGNRYLQELYLLLDTIPAQSLASYFQHKGKTKALRKRIEQSFAKLGKNQAQLATMLRVDAENLKQQGKSELSVTSLHKEWQNLSQSPDLHAQTVLLNRIQELIILVGNNSQLVLDPALDSKLLADILVHRLPSHCNQLSQVFFVVAAPGKQPATAQVEHSQMSLDLMKLHTLYDRDLKNLTQIAKQALLEDDNFYGHSETLQRRFTEALDRYSRDSKQFSLAMGKVIEGTMPLSDFFTVGNQTRRSCQTLLMVGTAELDILINKRIASYRRWQLLGFFSSGVALLLASFFIFSIAKNITRPIRAIIDYTHEVSRGNYKAPLAQTFQGELRKLARDIKSMVGDIVRLAAFPQENPNPAMASDSQGKITYLNKASKEVMRRLGIDIDSFVPPNHKEIIMASLATGSTRNGIEVGIKQAVFSWNYHPLPDHKIVHIYVRDITAQKRLEEQLQHDAVHDALTDLPNRALFLDRLEQVLRQHKSGPRPPFSVMFMDLDRFKLVNDSLGHITGDKLLIAVGERITSMIKEGDTLARLGGDEYALLLDNANLHQSMGIADRILNGLKAHFKIDDYELSVSTSIGIVVKENGEDQDADEILRDADNAMYRAKALGGSRHIIFDETMHGQALERLRMEVDLTKGIERDEFVVFYQPIVDAATSRIFGFEALVRWQHPEKGLVPPGVFIPLAEETGLIVPIGKRVLEIACSQARAWQENIAGYDKLMISVNLAVPQLSAPDLLSEVDQILLASGLEPETLKLEVTESGIMDNIEANIATLEAIKERNITLGIDDFGTGYSSLSYLHRFPFDTLKVDRSFVIEMEKDVKNLEIIKTIIDLAHNLHKKVICEGVETVSQLAQVKKLGCEYIQGYYFSKPVPKEEAEQLLKSLSLPLP